MFDEIEDYFVIDPSFLVERPKGPGPCPRCGGQVREIHGKHGLFYGCIHYPDCKGSRDHVVPRRLDPVRELDL